MSDSIALWPAAAERPPPAVLELWPFLSSVRRARGLDERPAPRLGRFAVKRAARIVPAYWLAMLGSFWLLSGTGHDYEVSARQLPLFAAFAQNYVGATAGKRDPPMWSLVVGVSFYIATSSRCRACRKAGDDGVGLVDDVVVGEAHDAIAGGGERGVLAAVAAEGRFRAV